MPKHICKNNTKGPSLTLSSIVLVLMTAVISNLPFLAIALGNSNNKFNNNNNNVTIFQYNLVNNCKSNEYYDFNIFNCLPCSSVGNSDSAHLLQSQPTADKLDCKCASRNAATMLIFNDKGEEQPHCVDFCAVQTDGDGDGDGDNVGNGAGEEQWEGAVAAYCLPSNVVNLFNSGGCKFKYVNFTIASIAANSDPDGDRQAVRITHFNWHNHSDCSSCDLRYNFQYQDYCIASMLLKPYLRYTTFWPSVNANEDGVDGQPQQTATHFASLKFVAFFCLHLRNATACQHLANLCVLVRYTIDRNSPCNPFLLAQAADQAALLSYANNDMDDRLRSLRPFLFYPRGKATVHLLTAPLALAPSYSLDSPHEARLHLLSSTHTFDGRLQRWGVFKLSTQLDLCQTPLRQYPWRNTAKGTEDKGGGEGEPETESEGVPFANRDRRQVVVFSTCEFTLEHLIDMAQMQANNNFVSIYLNYNSTDGVALLQAVPVLIEDLMASNQRQNMLEWQLVKRFQMIEAQPFHNHNLQHQQRYRRQHNGFSAPLQPYTDASKLHLYRQLRYVAFAELHYRINVHDQQRITLPLLRLRHRNVQLRSNASLDERLPFQLRISYELTDNRAAQPYPIVSALVLPVLLFCAVATAAVHTYGCYRRRHATAAAMHTQHAVKEAAAATHNVLEACEFAIIGKFLLHCASHVADALLVAYLIFVFGSALRYYTTHSLHVSLPLMQTQSDAVLGIFMYLALTLKGFFLVVHGWQISHCDIFFVDWERPRNYDAAHFNLKSSNLETSSMCSSVRTYTTECNVSAWRVFYTANEWIRLSARLRTSTVLQCIALLLTFELIDVPKLTHGDLILRVACVVLCYIGMHLLQLLFGHLLMPAFSGHPLKRFLDLCSLANVSVFTMLESAARGYYIHGRSPYGFADTDMSSMLVQLQRETQNMCGRRGLLTDSDHQMYIMVPPTNMRTYFDRLLVPFQRSLSISQAHYHKSATSSSSSTEHMALDRTTVAYSSVNRFFCAFIDHAIRDMDYIIKEKSFTDKLFNCEFDHYLSESRGIFYIDESYSFTRLFLHGNQTHIFTFELIFIICLYTTGVPLNLILVLVYVLNKFIQMIFRNWVRQNIAMKTLIDKRFLML